VTVPVCVIASFIALYAFGFSINLLTLLALVLCIGLVVDDAIVVVENIQRRVDLGEPALVAARRGTKQVAFAVLATTAVLVAVFLPVGFLQGNTGRLFRELSVALAAAVAISAFVALTLTPMLASKLLRPHTGPHAVHENRVSEWLNARFQSMAGRYRRLLDRHVHRIGLFGTLMLVALVALVALFKLLPSELAPAEDRGNFMLMMEGPEGAGFAGQAHPARQSARARQFWRQRGDAYRAGDDLPAALGQAQQEHCRAGQRTRTQILRADRRARAFDGRRWLGAHAWTAVPAGVGRARLQGAGAVARHHAGEDGREPRPGRC